MNDEDAAELKERVTEIADRVSNIEVQLGDIKDLLTMINGSVREFMDDFDRSTPF